LSRFFVRSFAQFGWRVGDLATNTLGGDRLRGRGFLLIPLGMRANAFVAATVNLIIAALTRIVDRPRDKHPSG
jgi:hypothetical protein